MLIISEPAMRTIMSALVSTSRSARDHNGNNPQIKTIDESTLRSAVLVALTIVSGQPCDTKPPE